MRSTVLRRGVAALAGTIVAALTLSGCLYSQIPQGQAAPRPGFTQDTSGVPAELKSFYGQEVKWHSCAGLSSKDTAYECADISVPLDYDNPGDRSIKIATIRHRATGEMKGSLLTNPGGPGASGLAMVRDSLTYTVSANLEKYFDVIGFDPRGVGQSTAVTCLSGTDMDHYLYDIPKGARDSDEWQKELDDRAKKFADACKDNSDGILKFITTENSARDMDIIRGVLGDKKLNYLGYSYGTFLGATYAKIFPERVGRLVLDGAIDPSVSGLDVGTIQSVGFESALRAYMEGCLAEKDCPFRGTVDQALTDLNTLMHSVDAKPLLADDGRELGSDSLQTAIIAAMYSKENWTYLTQALTEVMQGDPTTAFMLADFYNGRTGPGEYEDNSTEAFNAYNCMDYPPVTDQATIDAADAVVKEKAPTFYDFWGGSDVCSYWPEKPTGVREKITAEGAAPIVVIGTTNDPATPYAWAEGLASQLSSGVLVTRVGEGHTGYQQGSSCVDDAVDRYFVKDEVPQDGLRCEQG